MENFTISLKKNLKRNGFPHKKVAFNIEVIYEKCEQLGFSFNSLIPKLKEDNINVQIETERIVFGQNIENTREDLFSKAQDMMSKMSPEELQNIQMTLENMSDDQKEKMMDEAKKMGLF